MTGIIDGPLPVKSRAANRIGGTAETEVGV